MSGIARILVAVDGSAFADNAFHAAAKIARKFDSKLSAIHVVQTPQTLGVDKKTVHSLQTQLEIEAERMLSKYSDDAKSKYEIEIETIKSRGRPSDVIVDTANAKNIDLIVVGSRGTSGVKSLFLGSVSSDIVRSAKQPVLVIK